MGRPRSSKPLPPSYLLDPDPSRIAWRRIRAAENRAVAERQRLGLAISDRPFEHQLLDPAVARSLYAPFLDTHYHARPVEEDDGFGPGEGPSYGELFPETSHTARVVQSGLADTLAVPQDQRSLLGSWAASSERFFTVASENQGAPRRVVDGSSSTVPITARVEVPALDEQIGAPSAIQSFRVVGSSPREGEDPEYIPSSGSDGPPPLEWESDEQPFNLFDQDSEES